MAGLMHRFGRCRGALSVAVLMFAGCGELLAASPCPTPAFAPKASEKIIDWFDAYLRPFRVMAGIRDGASPGMDQIEAQIQKLTAFHRSSLRNSLLFEALMQQIAASYARAPDFRGIDTQAAGKIYQRGAGPELDFSLMCMDARTGRSADDTAAITLFGMSRDDCRHVGLRGLVFTETLINGAVNGECRPDHIYYRNWVIPVNAGTNSVTFLCRKDVGGCARQ